MHLTRLIEDVEKTHTSLGCALAIALITAKARMCLLFVSPAGCGKSTISNSIGSLTPKSKKLDSVTRSSLGPFATELTEYKGVILIDDLGKIDTYYSRLATITTFCELCYSHFVEKHTYQSHISVVDFHGSCIINCQPAVLKRVVQSPEWESTVQDKTLRYYHLRRPLNPVYDVPNASIAWGKELAKITLKHDDITNLSKLYEIGIVQWSRSRVLEHINNLLKATAALNGRTKVTNEDALLLYELMKPCYTEHYVMTKSSFEEGRDLNSNLLCLLTEFATYGKFSIRQVCEDYKISQATAYRLMEQYSSHWQLVSKNPTRYKASEKLDKAIKSIAPQVKLNIERGS